MFYLIYYYLMAHFLSTNGRNKKPCVLRSVDDSAPVVFEGAEVIDALCPVSSLTGNRMSIYEAVQMIGNEKFTRAIDALLPEIPSIANDSRLSDDDRVSMLMSRLDTGLPSENEAYRGYLSKIIDDFRSDVEKSSVKTDDNIEKSSVKTDDNIKINANVEPSNLAE